MVMAYSAAFFIKLHNCSITFLLFVPWQHLICSNRGVSHLNKACPIDELSRGSFGGMKLSKTTSYQNVL
jgi:hypothetical protein